MPAPLLAAGIMAGSNLLSQGINAVMQGSNNKASRRYNTYMYDRQRTDALADYTMQNQYNSPAEQMKRLVAAGLNPNLVYGNGADAMGGTVRSSSAGTWKPDAPQFDLGGAAHQGFSAYFDAQIKTAQTDNLLEQNKVLQSQKDLNYANAYAAVARGDITNVDLKYQDEMKQYFIENMKTGIAKQEAETTVMLDRNEREAAMQAPNLLIAAANVLKIRAEKLQVEMQTAKTSQEITNLKEQLGEIQSKIRNLDADTTIKEKEAQLYKNGARPGDWIWWRELKNIIGKTGNIFKNDTNSKSDNYRKQHSVTTGVQR